MRYPVPHSRTDSALSYLYMTVHELYMQLAAVDPVYTEVASQYRRASEIAWELAVTKVRRPNYVGPERRRGKRLSLPKQRPEL
jgi:hypothetical protein